MAGFYGPNGRLHGRPPIQPKNPLTTGPYKDNPGGVVGAVMSGSVQKKVKGAVKTAKGIGKTISNDLGKINPF